MIRLLFRYIKRHDTLGTNVQSTICTSRNTSNAKSLCEIFTFQNLDYEHLF